MLSLFSSDKERELLDLKRSHSSALQSLAKSRKQYEELTEEHSQGEQERANLRQENAALGQELKICKGELRACKDDLFRLQPASHVPDSKIAGYVNDLVEGICTWIDAEVSRYSDQWQKRHADEPPHLFHHGGTRFAHELLSNYTETAGEHVVRCMIQSQLYEKLLNDRVYLYGLGDSEATVLQLIEMDMRQLEPPRDAKTVRTWRSEALTSIVASDAFKQTLWQRQGQLATEVFTAIEPFFPIITGNQNSLLTFYDKVICPAVKLALAIQTSPTSYLFKPSMTTTNISQRYHLTKQNLADLKAIDAKTGKTLKADSPVVTNEDGNIGAQIALLTPGLWRRGPDEKPVCLTQEVLLMELYYPLGRRCEQPHRHQASGSDDPLA